jgi:hypothetical protein
LLERSLRALDRRLPGFFVGLGVRLGRNRGLGVLDDLDGFLRRGFGAGRAAFFFFNALIGLAFFATLRDCFTLDLRLGLAILASCSPLTCRAGKKWAILPQSDPQDLWALS